MSVMVGRWRRHHQYQVRVMEIWNEKGRRYERVQRAAFERYHRCATSA